MKTSSNIRVAIVADNAGTDMGGEAFLPYHFFTHLSDIPLDVRLIVHERARSNLENSLSPAQFQAVSFVSDTALQKFLFVFSRFLPRRVRDFSIYFLIGLLTQMCQRRILRELIDKDEINVIHHCASVSPRTPTVLCNLGVPVVIGPLNGNMEYPLGFGEKASLPERCFVRTGRFCSELLNRVFPGKLRADALIVANQRTREALPRNPDGRIVEMVENGIVTDTWTTGESVRRDTDSVRYIYCGALIPVKSVDLLIEAFAAIACEQPCSLTIVGEGELRPQLEELACRRHVDDRVHFTGQLTQQELALELHQADVFVFPSLKDCGGAAVLEAMFVGLPVIAAAWGGPLDYVTEHTGLLIEPRSRDYFIEQFSSAMAVMARDPEQRKRLGSNGRQRICDEFLWDKKITRVVEIYTSLLNQEPESTASSV